MADRQQIDVSWLWIRKNRWFLCLVALVVAGGVEMRVTLVNAVAQGNAHANMPMHSEAEKRVAVIESQNAFFNKRLDNLERGQRDLNVKVAEGNANSRATLEELRRLNQKIDR